MEVHPQPVKGIASCTESDHDGQVRSHGRADEAKVGTKALVRMNVTGLLRQNGSIVLGDRSTSS